ncbi:Peroxin-3-domain-containing protein [Boletus edulis]|uniref:Peroxin-3-domain-containing protein n=1 Tax=Boletus edulis BED1 TaxID=1328754 RepID=A0AAD4C976_BOLED|nr:Peroxin-3-domain-containing protein [Boletus edulis]KAF8452776.1 Peroxin-3-domain-containing protein [Boletus edulis BED1]
MLTAIQRYVHNRRRGLIQSATFLYGSYALNTYVGERLEDMKDKMLRTKLARDNLRRRFQSTHDDVCFTIMALMPTLAAQILEDMDVESLTDELQSLSRASRSRALQPPCSQPRSQSVSETSTSSDVHSDPGSLSFSSHSESGVDGDRASATSGSWIEHMSASEGPTTRPDIPARLSDSITSASSSLSHNTENSVTSTGSRTKGQLWNEVKILALTRTLTTLYTITLLSLFTAVQLNLLGRSRYIDSVRASDRAERARDQVPDFSLTGIIAREAVTRIVDVEAIWPAWILGESEDGDEEDGSLDAIPEATELRFLTLSWWVLHVGWKDVAARVRSSVESVFDDVSLKAKLSPSELFTLFMDVRRRVETDDTGSRPSARFLSSLLPPTPETTTHVLAQGGALSITRESETNDNIDRLLAQSPHPSCGPNRPSTHGDIDPPIPPSKRHYDGLSRASPIPIESPIRRTTFPTPPSSHAHESDNRLHPPLPVDISNSFATSRGTLDMDPQFNALLAQTRRYLSGPDFAYALGCALDRATEVLMDGLRARVFVDSASAVNVPSAEEAQARPRTEDAVVGASSEHKDEIKIRLAGMLPGLARWCQLALNATPNELVDNIMAVREVNALEAIIISDYEDRFPAIP